MKFTFQEGDMVLLRGPEPGGEPFRFGFNDTMKRLVGTPMRLGDEIWDENSVTGFRVRDHEAGLTWSWDINFIDPLDATPEISAEDFDSILD